MTMMSTPRGNADPHVRNDKHTRLHTSLDHAPLVAFTDDIATAHGLKPGDLPYPDPDGGSTTARALFLLSDPQHISTSFDNGSGLLSLDNDDATAATAWRLYRDTGLDRALCLHWNAVPSYLDDGQRQPRTGQISAGAAWLRRLLGLLPDLRVVVLMGGVAQKGWGYATQLGPMPDLTVLHTVHPANRGLNSGAGRQANIDRLTDVFEQVAEVIR